MQNGRRHRTTGEAKHDDDPRLAKRLIGPRDSMHASVAPCNERFCPATPPFGLAPAATQFALVSFVCNGSSTGGPPAAETLARALRLRRVLRRLGSSVTTVAVTHGFSHDSQAALRRAGWDHVHDVTQRIRDLSRLMRPIGSLAAGKAGKHWPRVLRRSQRTPPPSYEAAVQRSTTPVALKMAQKNATAALGLEKNYLGHGAFSSWAKWWELPRHSDPAAHACGALPLLAWNLTEFERVLVVAPEAACPRENPLPWMRSHAHHYLIGAHDRADDFEAPLPRRAWDGIDDRLLYLQPDAQLFELLMESAQSGSYLPFAGTARDVLETVFPTHIAFPPLFAHSRTACSSHSRGAAAGSGAGAAAHLVYHRASSASSAAASASSSAAAASAAVASSAAASAAVASSAAAVAAVGLTDPTRPPPRPSAATLAAPHAHWWMLYRGEVAAKRLWPKPTAAHAPVPAGCVDAAPSCHMRALGRGCLDAATARECRLSCGTCPALRSTRLAFVVFICNGGADHYGNPSTEQIVRALRLRRSLARLQSTLRTVAVVHGYDNVSLAALRHVGWEVRDISGVAAGAIMRQVRRETIGYHWPRYRTVQARQDNMCRAVHLLAWSLIEFDRIILSDLDLCMAEDPLPWLRRHAAAHFVAFSEMAKMRGFRGINVHMALLHPSEVMGRLVLDKARTASYVPYTRGAQDVIETVFATQVQFDEWPKHVHAMLGKVDYRSCERDARDHLRGQPASLAAFAEVDARMLAEERSLIRSLQQGGTQE